MTDMMESIKPKSNQLNADDLIGGKSITIKITKVSGVAGEQPIAVSYEGDNGKPYMPCKSMRRVLVNVWGIDGNAYVGRSMTLYCDPKVLFGGVAVGGIRISHMSHIDKEITMALTASKTNRKPFTVKPLHSVTVHAPDTALIESTKKEAAKGMEALKACWSNLPPAQQKKLNLAELKEIAMAADTPKETPSAEGCSDEPDSTDTAG